MIARWLVVIGLAVLPGCALVDQTTFNPDAGKKPVVVRPVAPVAAVAEPGPPPLLTIRLPTTADLRPVVAQAVTAARARKRDVAFQVIDIVPASGAEVAPAAERVAQLIVDAGVPAGRVALAARPIEGAAREVRVYIH